jgi:hypothetical protein
MSNSWAANLVNLLTLAMLPVYIGVHVYILPPSLSAGGITDAGFISIITLTLLGGTLVALLTLIFNTRLASSKLTAVATAYVIFIYFLREADLHRLLTIEHVTRSKFYTMSNVPMWQKVFAASILILLVVFLVYLLFKYTRVVWMKVRSLEPWAVAFLLWFIVLFISQLSDKSGLNHTHIGRVIEECSECWATAFIFLTVIQIIPTLKLQRPSKTQH